MSEIRKKQLKIALFNTYFPLIKQILIILNDNNNNNNEMHNYVNSGLYWKKLLRSAQWFSRYRGNKIFF